VLHQAKQEELLSFISTLSWETDLRKKVPILYLWYAEMEITASTSRSNVIPSFVSWIFSSYSRWNCPFGSGRLVRQFGPAARPWLPTASSPEVWKDEASSIPHGLSTLWVYLKHAAKFWWTTMLSIFSVFVCRILQLLFVAFYEECYRSSIKSEFIFLHYDDTWHKEACYSTNLNVLVIRFYLVIYHGWYFYSKIWRGS